MIRKIRFVGVCIPFAAAIACTTSSGGNTGTTGGAVQGTADTHCTGKPTVTVDPMACTAMPMDGGADAAPVDGGDVGDNYPPTMFNAEGDDDDCKYHVKWTSSGVAQGSEASFNVTLTFKKDGTPVRMASQRLEVFLDETHPAPNTNQKGAESSPGVYAVGPIRFDKPGRWTVRFHFSEECVDAENSPHGHAAFYVDVP